MDNKREIRLRRARATRARIRIQEAVSLCVYRSNSHLYAQVFSPLRDRVLVSASTSEAALRTKLPGGSNIQAAKEVGVLIASRCLEKGITRVAFDRSGYRYHGRIKALAEAAREKGLQI